MALKRRNRVEATFAMSSMTDLIFLLLLFFVMASTQAIPTDLSVNLPSSRSNKSTRSNVEDVYIDANGTYEITNEGAKQIVKMEELDAYLAQRQAEDSTLTIKLHADKDVAFDYVVNVLDVVNQHHMKLVVATNKQ